MNKINLAVRKMLISDMPELMRLKNDEGWNQTQQDWELLINYKDSVNLVGEMDNKIVGTITAINYENKVAWIGMMLVDKKYRRRGISNTLLKDAIAKLKECESIKLDATPAGHPVYKKIGFIDEYEIGRITNPSVSQIKVDNKIETQQMSLSEIDEIAQLDEQVFGANRKEMLVYLFNNSPQLAWVVKDKNEIIGFCLGRKGLRFTQIGPVYASSDKQIKSLITSALNQVIGQPVVVDLLADKKSIENWLTENGFAKQRTFERMYLNKNPYPGIIKKQYFISGPELA